MRASKPQCKFWSAQLKLVLRIRRLRRRHITESQPARSPTNIEATAKRHARSDSNCKSATVSEQSERTFSESCLAYSRLLTFNLTSGRIDLI